MIDAALARIRLSADDQLRRDYALLLQVAPTHTRRD
jgi:hypothetical protein